MHVFVHVCACVYIYVRMHVSKSAFVHVGMHDCMQSVHVVYL